ncbi:hypothetical protein PILCRDRAFT_5990 [Piloderma croceum F 1598]|uniref:DUF4604 domain-containing protein n=1 Tax=Piloderma croceum (strain F 1598) TaxID=765440 RepID=A0A0C3BFA7_PILCF|nr:hypothetical protein PILCRDRAFT_5990 [Piloderma croceum F 1598]
MPPRDPTNAQISSRLSYAQNTPSFLLKLQNRIAGIPSDEPEPSEYSGSGYGYGHGGGGDGEGEFYDDGSGRPPIPQRPAIPERPEDDPGSADEDDDGDEKPQVVVLREGKHLTEREAENVRRKERGLPPLPDPKAIPSKLLEEANTSNPTPKPKTQTPSLSFSSSKDGSSKTTSGKRKAIGDADAEEDKPGTKKGSQQQQKKKKAKKAGKTLLSFGDDEP